MRAIYTCNQCKNSFGEDTERFVQCIYCTSKDVTHEPMPPLPAPIQPKPAAVPVVTEASAVPEAQTAAPAKDHPAEGDSTPPPRFPPPPFPKVPSENVGAIVESALALPEEQDLGGQVQGEHSRGAAFERDLDRLLSLANSMATYLAGVPSERFSAKGKDKTALEIERRFDRVTKRLEEML